MTSLSTHVLDTTRGRPASGIRVTLLRAHGDARWAQIGGAVTDGDGRIKDFNASDALEAGEHRLVFETGDYLRAAGGGFYPRVTIDFVIRAGEHHHVPLLLSPYGYSTYRGS